MRRAYEDNYESGPSAWLPVLIILGVVCLVWLAAMIFD